MSIVSVMYLIMNAFIVFAAERFMRAFFDKRRTAFHVYIATFSMYFTVSSAVFLLFNIPLLNVACSIAALYAVTLNYKAKLSRRISAIAFVYSFLIITEMLVMSVSGYFMISLTESAVCGDGLTFPLVGLLFYFEALLAQNFKNIKRNNPVSFGYWISTVAIPVFSFFLITVTFIFADLSKAITITTAIVIFLINVLTFYLHDSLSKAYADRLKTTLLEQEKEYYYNQCELMRESTEALKAFKHDIQNHLSVAVNYANSSKINETAEYLSELIQTVSVGTNYSNSGNTAFDSIINYKLTNAKENGVDVQIDVAVPAKIGIDVIDIVTIVGNLLDNALNAVEQGKDPNQKRISLKIYFDKGRLVINIENTFNGDVQYKNAEIVSSKGEGHGYGLRNIRRSVDKYNGFMEIGHENGLFSVVLFLYCK